MTPEMLARLQAADDGGALDEPEYFDEDLADARLRPLIPQIEAILTERFDYPRAEPDSRYFSDYISYYVTKPSGHKSNVYNIALGLQFSKFGDLFNIYEYWISEKEKWFTQNQVEQVIALLEAAGFHYVDGESLDEIYTGRHPGMYYQEDISLFDVPESGAYPMPATGSWGDRFFANGGSPFEPKPT